jgi:hypothetical protein
VNRQRWQRWERGVEQRNLRESQLIYDRISSGDRGWLAELM